MIPRKGQFDGAARTRSKETLQSALDGTSPSRPGKGAEARSTMTPLALIQGFLRSSHSAQLRQIIPFAPFDAGTRMKLKRTAPKRIFPHRPAPSIAETGGKRPFRCLRPLSCRGRVRKGPARFEKRRIKRDAGRPFFWNLSYVAICQLFYRSLK